MSTLLRELYFGFIAILMFSELVARNLFSLIFQVERPAALMQVSIEVARNHMLIMILMDAIPGIGAALVLWAMRHAESDRLGRIGVITTTLGLLLFASYQVWYATYQLGNLQGYIKVVGVAYATLGIATWFIGKDIRLGTNSTEQDLNGTMNGTMNGTISGTIIKS